MIIAQAEIDEIRSARIRRRVLFLPVRFGEFGERKRCSLKPGGVYQLTPRVPYEQHKAQAQRQPTRARAVLALVALCEARGRDVTITVRRIRIIELDRPMYAIDFEKGDLSGRVDRPRLLAARPGGSEGDYTTVPARAVRGEGEAIPARTLERFASEGHDRHAEVLAEQRRRALVAIASIRTHPGSPAANRKLREAERRIKALDRHPLRRAV